MTRDEHLAWAKQRALEYLPRDPTSALASFMSDVAKWTNPNVPIKHPVRALALGSVEEHNQHCVHPMTLAALLPVATLAITTNDINGLQHWIEGWN